MIATEANARTVLVLGATGATGRLLVQQLLDRGACVRAVVRSPESLPEAIRRHAHLSLTQASVLELSDAEMVEHVSGCQAVASCLGHNLTLRGIFGKPRRLVTEAVRRCCSAIRANGDDRSTRIVLMNTAGNINRGLDESVSFAERCVIELLRWSLPPHLDNERAAEYLRSEIAQDDDTIQWVAVRPDSLINEDVVTAYLIRQSPISSAIFNPGRTSRINVAHFMTELIFDDRTWERWKGQMPVIYNDQA